MKKYIKYILLFLAVLVIFIIIFIIARKVSLNSYLSNTITYSDTINYSTYIELNINNSNYNSKIEYNIIRSYNINKITINNYSNDELISNIYEYIVTSGDNKGTYKYNGDDYDKSDIQDEEFIIDYKSLKNNILSIKKVDNLVMDGISYKKYTVKMKAYDAYNLIYSDEVLTKDDIDDTIDVDIYIDKSNEFVYEIYYKIDNLNNSTEEATTINYEVKIINSDINNSNTITLPF